MDSQELIEDSLKMVRTITSVNIEREENKRKKELLEIRKKENAIRHAE